jgi:hypothetical protein
MEAERPPNSSYAAIAATFFGGLTAATGLAKLLNREPRELDALDLVTLSAATFKLSRTISRDKVGSFVREPFVEGEAYDGHEEPAGEGVQRAIGELVTCTRCVGTWVAAALGSAQVVAPRFGRLVCWTLAAGAANDFLQAGFVAITDRSSTRENA